MKDPPHKSSIYRFEIVRHTVREPGQKIHCPTDMISQFRFMENYDREHILRVDLNGAHDGVRITPAIEDRLAASALTQEMGYEVRWRIDPILPVENWKRMYSEFFETAATEGHSPSRITLGTYREMGRSLSTISEKWGLPPMEWVPPKLSKDGMHYHIEAAQRIEIYQYLRGCVGRAWQGEAPPPIVALCKESKQVRMAAGLNHDHCNCG